jgi:hypothetical protein
VYHRSELESRCQLVDIFSIQEGQGRIPVVLIDKRWSRCSIFCFPSPPFLRSANIKGRTCPYGWTTEVDMAPGLQSQPHLLWSQHHGFLKHISAATYSDMPITVPTAKYVLGSWIHMLPEIFWARYIVQNEIKLRFNCSNFMWIHAEFLNQKRKKNSINFYVTFVCLYN